MLQQDSLRLRVETSKQCQKALMSATSMKDSRKS